MTAIQDWARQLMVGTERKALEWPTMTGEPGQLVASLSAQSDAPETLALRTAGVLWICQQAGIEADKNATPPVPPCPDDLAERVQDPALLDCLHEIFKNGPAALQEESLTVLRRIGLCLPFTLLPSVLHDGHALASLRPALLPVLGERGHWLARHNPDWAYAAHRFENQGPEQAISDWDEGNLAQRKAYLLACRKKDPVAGLQLLRARWKGINLRERLQMLEIVGQHLHPDDQDFLESLLVDKGKEVRQQAIELLCRIPHSRYLGRMQARLEACLQQEQGFFKKKWRIDAPPAFVESWQQDGLEEQSPSNLKLGSRAYCLYQIARCMPLSFWTQHTQMSAAQLLQWSQAGDWSAVLHLAWRDAWSRQAEADWAQALIKAPPAGDVFWDPFELAAALPSQEREAYWLASLNDRSSGTRLGYVLSRIAASLQATSAFNTEAAATPPLSSTFARQVLTLLKEQFRNAPERADSLLKEALPNFVCLIPADCLLLASQDWPDTSSVNLSETIARTLHVALQRMTLQRFINQMESL